MNIASIETVFVSLAVIFVTQALRNYFQAEGKLTVARSNYLRMSTIFAIIGGLLCLLKGIQR